MSKIVLVEDEPTLQNLLQTLLVLEGFVVALAPPGNEDEIADCICAEKPDVVLLDVHLKAADGLTVLGRLQSRHNEGVRPRVIMTSGMDVREQCLHAGADGFILKPYMPSDLVSLLKG